MKLFFNCILFLVALGLPEICFPQNILWERTFTDSADIEVFNDVEVFDDGSVYAVGSGGGGGEPYKSKLMKLDSNGHEIWSTFFELDSAPRSLIAQIIKVKDEDNFYISGNVQDPQSWKYDYIAKIDTAGDTLWTRKYSYPTFFGTVNEMIQLKDKSIVSVGSKLTINDYDAVARRVDSLGNLMWEETYSLTGGQVAYDITEMMDGSLVVAGSSDGDNLLLRIGFDGRMIETNSIGFTDNLNLTFYKLNHGNTLLNTSVYQISAGDYQNLNILNRLNFLSTDTLGIGATKSLIDIDTNATILYSDGAHSRIVNMNLNSKFRSWDLDLMPQGIPLVSPSTIKYYSNNSIIAAGFSRDSLNIRKYWLAKIDGVGEEWIPDRCAFSPPVAGFAYDLNGGILTLQDTSYAGLKYLDTIYTWQWTFGNGMVDTTESPITLWDTISAPTLDVELIVSNWYGCKDTLQTTLIANPVGTGIIAMNQFTEKVWPNPARDVLNIGLSEKPGQTVMFEIFDVHGRVQKTMSFEGAEATLNISSLPQGIYFYRLSAGGMVKRGKVVKG